MTVYEQRQIAQANRRGYRVAAKRLIADNENMLVPDHADVHEVEDGAFVECVIFIPKEKLTHGT